MKSINKIVVLSLIGILFASASFAGKKEETQSLISPPVPFGDIIRISSHLNSKDLASYMEVNRNCADVAKDRSVPEISSKPQSQSSYLYNLNWLKPIRPDHGDTRVRVLYEQLRQEKPHRSLWKRISGKPGRRFFDLGGNEGKMYVIKLPDIPGGFWVDPFILSGIAPRKMNRKEAIGYCEKIGATIPTKEQGDAIRKLMSRGGVFNQDSISDMSGNDFWLSYVSTRYPDADYFFSADDGDMDGDDDRNVLRSVRCVRPAYAWDVKVNLSTGYRAPGL